MYAKIKDNILLKYPYDFNELKLDNPYSNFSTNDVYLAFQGTEKNLQGEILVEVTTSERPVFNTETQYLTINSQPELVNGNWVLNWTIHDKTPEELALELIGKRNGMVVSPLQAKAAILQAGLMSSIEALMVAEDTPAITKLAWEYAIEWRRNSPMVQQFSVLLNLTDEQLDNLFELAATIEV